MSVSIYLKLIFNLRLQKVKLTQGQRVSGSAV